MTYSMLHLWPVYNICFLNSYKNLYLLKKCVLFGIGFVGTLPIIQKSHNLFLRTGSSWTWNSIHLAPSTLCHCLEWVHGHNESKSPSCFHEPTPSNDLRTDGFFFETMTCMLWGSIAWSIGGYIGSLIGVASHVQCSEEIH